MSVSVCVSVCVCVSTPVGKGTLNSPPHKTQHRGVCVERSVCGMCAAGLVCQSQRRCRRTECRPDGPHTLLP